MLPDQDTCMAATRSRDPRFDGWFYVAVTSTGIYCRPSCPAAPAKPQHLRFYPTAAAAQAAGYRACLRCRPDASPGSPQWDLRADVAGRAMRLIRDGVVDREGVDGLARRLAYSPRQLRRLLHQELGAGPVALARAQRAQTARTLVETTDLPLTDVAFAAGFGSVRQFNDTLREVFARSPRELRARAAGGHRQAGPGTLSLRLAFRRPLHAAGLLAFFGQRAVCGVEKVDAYTYRRTLRLPHGAGTATCEPLSDYLGCRLRLADLRDLAVAVARVRGLFDLDADPVAVDAALAGSPVLAPLIAEARGRRIPGSVDGAEIAVRAVVGQQVSVASARRVLERLTEAFGEPLAEPYGSLTHVFPSAAALAEAPAGGLPLPTARAATLRRLTAALAAGDIDLDPGSDRDKAGARLLELPGVGPWTVAYVRMRALGDTDAFPATDMGLLRAWRVLGTHSKTGTLDAQAHDWRPWRAYAAQHLWAAAGVSGTPSGRQSSA